jgi:transcriptional regulator
MYVPEQFREQDVEVLQDFMEHFNFATLVTQSNGAMIASHLPFVLERHAGPYGALRAHLAKKNPQYEHLQSGSEAFVIFQGPHAYISPMWYANQRNVPTWNYAVVHAYGKPRMLGDEELIELLEKLVQEHEGPSPPGWAYDSKQPWIAHMLREIGGFEIPVTDLQGKFKLNQNRTPADRQGVIDALVESEDPMKRAIAGLMKTGRFQNQ